MEKVKSWMSNRRKYFFPIVGLLAFLAIGSAIIYIPKLQVQKLKGKDKLEMEDKVRTTLTQIIGGSVLFITAYFTWKGMVATKEAQEKQFQIAISGQVTDRFIRAIDQLNAQGETNITKRLGGIYSLERIAKDSDVDRGSVFEILASYVRENAPRLEKDDEQDHITTDIQAILTVIGRRESVNMKEYWIDLSNTNISNAKLFGANLTDASLYDTNLTHTDLSHANLTHSYMAYANLSSALLFDAILLDANLNNTILTNTILTRADLSGADITDADLTDANLLLTKLSGAKLQGAKLTGVLLIEANLTNANLTKANLSGADLRQANLTDSILSEASLPDANLIRTNLTNADLSNANLTDAKLYNTDLSQTLNLTQEQLDSALTDETTKVSPPLKIKTKK